MTEKTISQAISAYLDSVALARSKNTARTYKNALQVFKRVLDERWFDPESMEIEKLSEDAITWLAEFLKVFSAPTERLYLTAVSGFYEYVAAHSPARTQTRDSASTVSCRGHRKSDRAREPIYRTHVRKL